MLERKDIKDGTLVFDEDNKTYHIIKDVGDAVAKGDRGGFSETKDELSYSIVNILNGDEYKGICEHSGMTACLNVATETDVNLYLMNLEADAMLKLARAKKEFATIGLVMAKFTKLTT